MAEELKGSRAEQFKGSREVKLPSGKVVMLGPKSGTIARDIDIMFHSRPPAEQEWKWQELMARRIRAIDGKSVTGYNHTRFASDLDDRDQEVLLLVAALMDNPRAEHKAEAFKSSGLLSAEAMDESLALYRVSGGSIDFETAMTYDDATRKLTLAWLVDRLKQMEEEMQRGTTKDAKRKERR